MTGAGNKREIAQVATNPQLLRFIKMVNDLTQGQLKLSSTWCAQTAQVNQRRKKARMHGA